MTPNNGLKYLSLAVRTRPRLPYRSISTDVPSKIDSNWQDEVIFQETGTSGTIILNRPKSLNSLNLLMSEQIHAKLTQWESTKKLVMIKGAGGRAFCSGGDLRISFVLMSKPGGEIYPRTLLRNEYIINYLIATYKKPYIALINGITIGAGAGLSVHGKYRIATEKTLFAMPETAIGLYPDNGSTFFLPRLRGRLGFYLGLTGHRLNGIDAKIAGIATHYVMSDKIDNLADELAKSDGNDIESILDSYEDKSAAEFSLAPYIDKIDKYFSANTVEEIIGGLMNDGSEWAMDVAENLRKMSPTSLKVGHRTMNTGRTLSLAKCLKAEYRLTASMVKKDSDFYEGIRAKIIDKDDKPAWNPRTIQEVTNEYIETLINIIPSDGDIKLRGQE